MWNKCFRYVKANIPSLLSEFARWVRYIYFLRFSIILWLFPVLLVWANSPAIARSLVSGIVTPVTPMQYLCVSFFLISGSFVALILARVVVINGNDRFGDDPPTLLTWLMANPRDEWEWLAPGLSQVNNAFVFWYFFHNGATEQVDSRFIRWGLLGGTAMALAFWYAMTAVYYLIYRPGPGSATANAKTLILPRFSLRLSKPGEPALFGDALERAELPFTLDWLSRLFPAAGYRWLKAELNRDGTPRTDTDGTPLVKPDQLYEGHFFSLMAAFGFYCLYWVLYPMTAPVLVPHWAMLAMVLYCLGAAVVFLVVLFAEPHPGDEVRLRIWKAILGVLIFGSAIALPILYYRSDPERFPILASVLILVISMSWTFGALAFLFDRFRVPVLTVFLVVLVSPRLIHWSNGQPVTGAQEEHYLSYTSIPAMTGLPTPGQVLDSRLRLEYCSAKPCEELPKNADPTLIVVTSTGGGIHAAAWTTAVLAQLEQRFSNNFHRHVLMLSTVSGGSVGLYDYLRELDPATNGNGPDWSRMTKGARCSSLEAVGWGLIYYDIPKAVIPVLPYVVTPSSGADDLDQRPLDKDRTWSLRRAMARNLNDPFCANWAYTALSADNETPVRPDDPQVIRDEVAAGQRIAPDNGHKLTLAKLRVLDETNPFPAFTMNTTTVEGGNRFLLANYFIKRENSPDPLVSNPAYSFLDIYGNLPFTNGSGFVDLPLATAAQLSATFPYVSSAATLKPAKPQDGAHFVDGGYYDNDGTASAIEFLRYAVAESALLHPHAKPSVNARPGGAKSMSGTEGGTAPILRILLVEIRNSPDATGVAPLVSSQDQGKPWNVVSQIVAPLQGFWSAGHESITGRNRNALGLLEGDLHGQIALQHFVIDDQATAHANPPCVPANSVAADPLNWYLTPCQQIEIDISAQLPYNTDKYKAVRACYADGSSKDCPPANKEEQPR
jgi:hypothetical protein